MKMFTVEQIQSLNELEMEVYLYVMKHQSSVRYMRIRELAAKAHVSTTTVERFCKKMGCDGFMEFKLKMKEAIGQKEDITVPEDLYDLKYFLNRAASDEFQEKIDAAAAMIARVDQILCIGICNSGYIAQYAARYFSSFGKVCFAVTDPFYPMKQMENGLPSVAIFFSVSGEAKNPLRLAKLLKGHKCRILSVTNTDKCTIARISDINIPYYITVRRKTGENGCAENIDFTSQVPAVIIAETLAKRVANRLTEQEE